MQNKHPGFKIKPPAASLSGHPLTRTHATLNNAPKPSQGQAKFKGPTPTNYGPYG